MASTGASPGHGRPLEGQYIIKNIVIVSAAIVLGATVRGGELVPEPVDEGGAIVRSRDKEETG
jgi:hypothetical protein